MICIFVIKIVLFVDLFSLVHLFLLCSFVSFSIDVDVSFGIYTMSL